MKSILISMPPKKVARLLDGSSRIIFVKGKPKCDLPSDVYIYCTKDKNEDLYYDKSLGVYLKDKHDHELGYEYFKGLAPLNGKVGAKFTLTNAEKVYEDEDGIGIFTDTLDDDMLYKLSGLGHDDLDDSEYDPALAEGNLYAWYAAWPEVLDVPMELSEFSSPMGEWGTIIETGEPIWLESKLVTKAPSSWMYVEAKE